MDNDLITEDEERKVLLAMASILKKNCEKYQRCTYCPLHGKYKDYAGYICPLSVGQNPCEWALD